MDVARVKSKDLLSTVIMVATIRTSSQKVVSCYDS